MPNMNLTHFEATFLFAMLGSAVLGVVSKRTDHERLVYGLRSFGYFVLTVFGLAWAMYLGHR
jgi:hypothetical protein